MTLLERTGPGDHCTAQLEPDSEFIPEAKTISGLALGRCPSDAQDSTICKSQASTVAASQANFLLAEG